MSRVETVTLDLCSLCLDGISGECHVPGCALWMSTAPDVPLRDKVLSIATENVRLRQALEAVAIFLRVPHTEIGQACGVDACIACLAEGTVREALEA